MLDKLLDVASENDGPSPSNIGSITEEDLDFETDFGGLSLQDLAAEVEDAESSESQAPRRLQTADDC